MLCPKFVGETPSIDFQELQAQTQTKLLVKQAFIELCMVENVRTKVL